MVPRTYAGVGPTDIKKRMTSPIAPVVIEGLSVRRGRRLVLKGVSLEVKPGVTAVLGVNGAGKTSLLGAVTSQFPAVAGQISWNGERVDGRRSQRFLATLGWLPQTLTFPKRMKVKEVIEYAVWLKQAERSRKHEVVRVALVSAGLDELQDRRMGELSGGQQRLVGLAAATVCRPEILLFDEPTVGLDPIQREAFHGRIKVAAEGRVAVVATHLLEDVAATASRVIVIDRGRVLFKGTLRGLCNGEDANVDNLRRSFGRLIDKRSEG